MDPKFYENDFYATKIKEIEYIRSPFYDLSMAHKMEPDEANQLLEDISLK